MRGRIGAMFLALLGVACVDRADVLATRDGSVAPDLGLGDAGTEDSGIDDGGPPDLGQRDAATPPIEGRRTVAAATDHTCALGADGLYCWGRDDDGELGNGPAVGGTDAPTRVARDANYVSVVALANHTCALDSAGALYCWGSNEVGQLGLGDRRGRDTPTPVPLPEPAIEVDTGYTHTCAILESGALYCWGSNEEGQLGIEPIEATESLVPERVGTESDWVRYSAGQGHSCGLRGSDLWCWGRNSTFQLGLGLGAPIQRRLPTAVGAGAWMALASGQNHGCGLQVDGALACWGDNSSFQLGSGDLTARPEPTVTAPGPWARVDTDTFHGCTLAATGMVTCWGRNAEGQLGTGDIEDRMVPTEIAAPDSGSWAEISTGRFHTCARDVLGDVYCTGMNEAGQLGTGDLDRRRELTLVLRISPG